MSHKRLQTIRRRALPSRGAALSEFGIVTGLVSVLAIGAVLALGTRTEEIFETAAASLGDQACDASTAGEVMNGGTCAVYAEMGRSVVYAFEGKYLAMSAQSLEDPPNEMEDTETYYNESNYGYGQGARYTKELIANPGSQPAAEYCDGLVRGKYSDWHLPAGQELSIALNDLADKGGHEGQYFWHSEAHEDVGITMWITTKGEAALGSSAPLEDKYNVVCVRAVQGA